MKTIVLLLGGMVFWYSCKKQDCLREFEFHFPATITVGDTFAIGDTLWMSMDLPNELVDHQTGELIDLSQFDLYFSFGINKIDTMYVNNYIDNFELIEKIGMFSQHRGGRFTYTYVNFKSISSKQFYLGFIPKKKGVFLMALSLPLEYGLAEEAESVEDRLKITNSYCSYQDVTRYSGAKFNNGIINHYLSVSHPCRIASPIDTITICTSDSIKLANKGGYVFVVD